MSLAVATCFHRKLFCGCNGKKVWISSFNLFMAYAFAWWLRRLQNGQTAIVWRAVRKHTSARELIELPLTGMNLYDQSQRLFCN